MQLVSYSQSRHTKSSFSFPCVCVDDETVRGYARLAGAVTLGWPSSSMIGVVGLFCRPMREREGKNELIRGLSCQTCLLWPCTSASCQWERAANQPVSCVSWTRAPLKVKKSTHTPLDNTTTCDGKWWSHIEREYCIFLEEEEAVDVKVTWTFRRKQVPSLDPLGLLWFRAAERAENPIVVHCVCVCDRIVVVVPPFFPLIRYSRLGEEFSM